VNLPVRVSFADTRTWRSNSDRNGIIGSTRVAHLAGT